MRIGTWNVEYGYGTRNADRLARLRATPADIWVLTETHRDLELSATHVPVTSEPRLLRRDGSTWVTIWSRFPLVRRLPVPDPRRMAAALLDVPGRPVAVAGVVLPWQFDVGDEPADPRPASWSEHRRVIEQEVPALLRMLRAEAVDARRVLAGDFNTGLRRPYGYGRMAERRKLEEFLQADGFVCHTADVLYPPPSPARTLIDHVCTDFGTAASIETWPGVDGRRPRLSDHPGVVVSLDPTVTKAGLGPTGPSR
jgi:endonuclease/exonuclease/phosphatase family metal-dependent hydrolase